MYAQLRSRLAEMLSTPMPMKSQTERQVGSHMAGHTTSITTFLLSAAEVLEDYELEIIFGPQFTPGIEQRAAVADLLYHWRPSDGDLQQLISDLLADVPMATIALPDGTTAKLAMHEVLVDRFVRLLRLQFAPDAPTSAALREALPSELWPIAVALACERGFTAEKQTWFAAFVAHVASRRDVSPGMLHTITDFIVRQNDLSRAALMTAAEALHRAAEQTAAYVARGRSYWSVDVAQHHQYRGAGHIDADDVQRRQDEVEWLAAMAEDLTTFEEKDEG